MQTVDPDWLARAIGTDFSFWPLDYDLTRAQWAQREADAKPWARLRSTMLHGVKRPRQPGPSPVVAYSRDLIRLAFLPKKLRTQVLEQIARLVKMDIDQKRLPAPRAWRRRKQGRTPIYLGNMMEVDAEGNWVFTPRARFHSVAVLKALGCGTAEIVDLLERDFGMQWPGQREPHGDLTDKQVRAKLRKLHRDTVLRDVKKARRERARMAKQR